MIEKRGDKLVYLGLPEAAKKVLAAGNFLKSALPPSEADQLRAALADIVDTWRASLAADDAEALRVLGETIERYENLVEKRG